MIDKNHQRKNIKKKNRTHKMGEGIKTRGPSPEMENLPNSSFMEANNDMIYRCA